jgi:hypothetical protein
LNAHALRDHETPINFSPTEIWHGELIARALGKSHPWSPSDLADLYEAMMKAYDATRRVATLERGVHDPRARKELSQRLTAGHSILDEEDVATAVLLVTNSHPSPIWGWDDEEWLRWEATMHSCQRHSATALARKFDLTYGQSYGLIQFYGRDTRVVASDGRVRAIIATTMDAPLEDVLAALAAEGVKMKPQSVERARRKIKASGQFNRTLESVG